MNDNYYNIRMHASAQTRHVSGAERIVFFDQIDDTVGELIARARSKTHEPDKITVTIENLGRKIPKSIKALDVFTVDVTDPEEGRSAALKVLGIAGITEQATGQAIRFLSAGAAPSGENMRGAMILDAQTGDRLEPDPTRGVRASR